MTSKLTRERIELIANFHRAMTLPPSHAEIEELARMALVAMDSEPHTDDELSNLLWYSQEATCHSDPNYYCEFQRLATPGLIAGIIRELQERRKAAMGSKPVILYRQINPVNGMKTYWAELDPEEFRHLKQHTDENAEFMTLYRHAQPAPVVPEEKPIPNTLSMYAVDAVAAIAEVKGWNACRAAMLAADPQLPGSDPATVPGKWIPVSERMPEDEQEVLTINKMGHRFVSFFDKHSGLFFDRLDAPAACCIEHVLVTHWMPLPAAPQEVK